MMYLNIVYVGIALVVFLAIASVVWILNQD